MTKSHIMKATRANVWHCLTCTRRVVLNLSTKEFIVKK